MAELFVASKELEDKANQIIRLYNKYLGRDPLQGGLDAWLATGQSIEQIEQGIANSPEASVVAKFSEGAGRLPSERERQYLVVDQPTANVDAFVEQVAEEEGYDPLASTIDVDTTADDTIVDTAGVDDTVDTAGVDDTAVNTTVDDVSAATGSNTYTVITSNAKGGASSPFGGSAESNETAQLVEMTEQELRQEFEDSGQLQDLFGSFENYMGYINDSQDWVQSADWMLANPEYRPSDIEFAVIEGEDRGYAPGQREEIEQQIRADRVNARQSGYQQWMNEGAELLQKWGIQDTIYNDDGDQFKWTGSGYQKTIKIDDHASFADYAIVLTKSVVAGLLTGAFGGPLTTALKGAGMSGAAASATSQAITTMAAQAISTGDVDVKTALVSAAIGYGGDALGNFVQNSAEVDSALGSIASSANEAITKLQGLLETGMPIADAAIQAGGMSLLTQLVSTGDINIEQAAVAALMAGGAEAIGQLANGLGRDAEEFMADLAEQEEFQQAAIDADIKDPFLNPNYQTVGDGSVVLNTVTNEVFSVTDNKSLGQFNELDSNSDGILDSNDLSFVEVTATQVQTTISKGYENLDPSLRHYVDADGNIRTDVRGISRETGAIIASDGTELFEARYDNGKLLVADETGAFNTIRNNDGSVYGTYNPETDEWVGADGQALDPSVGEYMATKSGVVGSGNIYTGITKTEYAEMSGSELFDDYFVNRGSNGQLALGDAEMQELVNRFGSGEAFEDWLQENNYGVNYSSTTGYVFEANVDTSDGIYGLMGNDSTIPTLFEADELSGTRYFNADYVATTTTEQIPPPWEDTTITKKTTTDTGGGVTSTSEQAVTALTESLSSSTSSESASTAVTTAAASGLSAAEIATVVSNALSGGAISSETASAASAALEGISGKGDTADSGLTVADSDGETSIDTGGGGTTVTVSTQDSGMLTGNNVNVGTSDAGTNVGASNVGTSASGVATTEQTNAVKAVEWILSNLPNYNNMTEVEINQALQGAGLNPVDINNDGTVSSQSQGVTAGGVTNGGTTNGGVTNGGVTNGGVTNGGVTNGGVTNGGVTNGGVTNGGTTNGGVTNGGTTNGGTTNGGVTNGGTTNGGVTNGGVTNGGTTNGVVTNGGVTNGGTNGNGNGNGDGDGDGDGTGPGSGLGLGGAGIGIGGASGMLAGGGFAPLTQRSIRIQAPEMLPDIVRQQDAVAQLMKAISTPYGTKPSGQQLNGLFDRLLLDQEKIA